MGSEQTHGKHPPLLCFRVASIESWEGPGPRGPACLVQGCGFPESSCFSLCVNWHCTITWQATLSPPHTWHGSRAEPASGPGPGSVLTGLASLGVLLASRNLFAHLISDITSCIAERVSECVTCVSGRVLELAMGMMEADTAPYSLPGDSSDKMGSRGSCGCWDHRRSS